MQTNNDSKLWNRRSIFGRVYVSLTVPMLLASNLTTAALANDGKGAAWQQFRLDNPDLRGKELNSAFKDHWQDVRDVHGNDGANAASQNAVNQAINNAASNVAAGAASHLNVHDFATKAEFKAYKESLKQQNIAHQINQSIQQIDGQQVLKVNGGFNLDLTSAVETITLGNNLFKEQSSVNINVGGESKTVQAGSKVTAAEYVAAKQALVAGGQTVTLDGDGRATGGSVDLSALTSGNGKMKVDDLVVPVSVVASGDFGKGGDVRIKGDLINSGSINAFSSSGNVNAIIRADNITNNIGADITSTASDLTLQADKALKNFGTINATGNLTLSAEKSLTNSGTVSAAGNLNIQAANVTNTGTLASTDANVNFGTTGADNLLVNNYGGTIAALNGAINLRDAAYEGLKDTTVVGGDLLSQEVNVYTGGGTANVYVNELTGVVNSSGSAAHVSANTDTLTIGEQCLTGDPTYFNTGNISIAGNIIVGEDLAIIAGRDIIQTAANLTIRAVDSNGDGRDIIIVAGANVTGTGSQYPGAATTASFSGGSAQGGQVLLSQGGLVDASGNVPGSKAGNITIAAYSDGISNDPGKIIMSNWDIKANGNGTAAGDTNGNISLISGSIDLATISVRNLQNTGGTGSGTISLVSAAPTFDVGSAMTFGANGNVTSGNKLVAGTVGNGVGVIQVSDIDSSGDVFVLSNGAVQAGSIKATNSSTVTLRANTLNNTVSVGLIDVSSNQAGVDAGSVVINAARVNVNIINLSGAGGRSAGTLVAELNSANTVTLNGSMGVNYIGQILSNPGSGDGAIVDVTNNGTGGIRVANVIVLAAGVSRTTGSLKLTAPNGNLDLSAYTNGINVSGSALNGGNAGDVSLIYDSLTVNPAVAFAVSANAGFNGTAGTINIERTGTGTVSIGTTAGNFNLSATGSGGTINASAGGLLTATGSALSADNINLESGTGGVFGMNLAGAFTGKNMSLRSPNSIFNTAGTTLNFTGNLSLITPSVTFNGATYTAQNLSIDSLSATGSDLALSGGAAATLNANLINIGAVDTLSFSGNFLYNGQTILSGQSISATGSTQTMQNGNTGYIVTPNLNGGTFNGTWVSTATPLSGISVVNNPGSVVMSGDIVIAGNFAIVASGNVDLTGASINLSGPTAGSLSIFAGYNSNIVTNGTQTPTDQTINNLTASTDGGSVIGGANINVSGTGSGGHAGSVTVVARKGSIDLGDILATGDLNDGFVKLIGETGVTVGDINTTASGGLGGGVSISVGQAGLAGVSITNGALSGTVFTAIVTSGNIKTGAITAGIRNLVLNGAFGANDKIEVESLNAQFLDVNTVAGSTTFGVSNVQNVSGSGGGSFKLVNTGDVAFSVANNSWDVDVTSTNGALSFNSVSFNSLKATSFGDMYFYNPSSTPSVSTNADLTTTGSGSIFGVFNVGVGGTLKMVSANDIGDSNNEFTTGAGSIDAYAANNAFLNVTNSAVNFTGGGAGYLFRIGTTATDAVLTTSSSGINAPTVVFLPSAAASIGTSSNFFKVNNNGAGVNVQLSAQNGSADETDVFVEYLGNSILSYTTSDGGNTSLRTPDANAQVLLNGTVTGVAGNLDITTNYLTIDTRVQADGNISIQSNAGSGLIVESLAPTASFNSDGTIEIRANTGTLTLTGSQIRYYSSVDLFGETVLVDSVQVAQAPSRIFTGNLIIGGGGALVTYNDPPQPGDTWTLINGGTYANGTGDITLTGPLNFGDLAIIAAGNITINGDIDLSGSQGGDLTMFAGYNFTPSPSTTTFDPLGTYTDFTPNANGGSITVTGNINTTATNGNGGNVIAVANNGAISLQNIDTTATGGTAGKVLLIGGTGVTLNNVNADGASSTTIAVADAQLFPQGSTPFQIQGGVVVGDVGVGALRNGTISVNDVNVGTTQYSSLKFQTAETGTVNIGGSITSNQIEIQSGNLTVAGSQLSTAGSAGSLRINVSTASPLAMSALGLGNDNGGQIDFTLRSTNAVTLGLSGQYTFDVSSQGTGNGGIVQGTFGGDVTLAAGSVVANGTGGTSVGIQSDGNITVNAAAFSVRNQNGNGSGIGLSAGRDGTGVLTLNDLAFFQEANGNGTDSNGGSLSLVGNGIVTPGIGNSVNNPLVLTAAGTGNGNGGSVSYVNSSSTPIFVGAPPKAPKGNSIFIEVEASAGDAVGSTGRGGSAIIRSGGNLTVSNTSLINIARGENGTIGSSYNLGAGFGDGKGQLIVNGSLSTNGNQGSITLESDSKTAFVLNGSNVKNGITGTLDAGNGIIEIINASGGIVVQTSGAIAAANVLELTSLGTKGKITTASGVTLDVREIHFETLGGAIGSKNSPINVESDFVRAITAGKGSVFINNLNLADSGFFGRSGGSLTLTTAGSVQLDGFTTQKGNILVVTNGNTLSVSNDSEITANNGSLTLQNANVAGQIQIGDGATVETQQKGGNTILAVGAVPKRGTNPISADGTYNNINVNVEGKKGIAYFGGPPNAVIATTTANVNAINKSVIFSGPSGSIVLGDGATVTADPPVKASTPSVQSSFSLENSSITSDLSVLSMSPTNQAQAASNETLMTASTQNLINTTDWQLTSLSSLSNESVTLNAAIQNASQLAYNASLQTPNQIATSSATQRFVDDDDSYIVGSMGRGGVTEAAICSDSEFVGKQLGLMSGVKTIGHSERVELKRGVVLFVPSKATAVETPNGIVHISANSVTLVSTSEAGLSVYDLDDQHKGSVRVESNGHNVVLSPGRHVMITKHHTAEFAQINAVETISHRNVQSTIKNGHRAHTSEFSVLSAMDSVSPLKALASSKHADAKHVTDRMIKTTAIMLHLGGSGGQYQHYFKPRLTAYGQ
jgi:hypothetical protein